LPINYIQNLSLYFTIFTIDSDFNLVR